MTRMANSKACFLGLGLGLAFIALPALGGARAEGISCGSSPPAAPVLLWVRPVAQTERLLTRLVKVVSVGKGQVLVLGVAEPQFDNRTSQSGRLFAISISETGVFGKVRFIDLPAPKEAVPKSAPWFNDALGLPTGDVVAVAGTEYSDVPDRNRSLRVATYILRVSADGTKRSMHQMSVREGEEHETLDVRLFADGPNHIVILGSTGPAPSQTGIFIRLDASLNEVAHYRYANPSSVIFDFAHAKNSTFALFGDLGQWMGNVSELSLGRFRIQVNSNGKLVTGSLRIGPSLSLNYAETAEFDRNDAFTILIVPKLDERTDAEKAHLVWMDHEGRIQRSQEAPPPANSNGQDFPHVRIDPAGCIFLFRDKGSKIFRLDSNGDALWKVDNPFAVDATVRAVLPMRDGGFIVVGDDGEIDASRANKGWIARYGYR